MVKYLFFFLISAGFSFVLTPFIRSFAKWANVYDLPSARKIHKKPVPPLGGVAIFIAFNLTIIIGVILNDSYLNSSLFSRWQALLLCQIIILALGVADDVLHLQPGVKFLIQIFVGVLVFVFGFGISVISNPFTGNIIHLGILSIPLTVIWLVGITNALNLVDGLDGLASGIAFIVCMTIGAIAYMNENSGIVFIALSLAGSIIGFLRYNFYPAKIFLGDSGSLLLGFLLAVISIQASSKGATLVAVLAPILALGFPIVDTLLSMIRRLLQSIHIIDYPTKNGRFRTVFFKGFSVFKADKDHTHHRLLRIGFSQRKAVVILYAICVALSILSLVSVAIKHLNLVAFLGAIFVGFFIGVRSLKYQEFKILENGLLIPIFDFPVINSSLFQAFFDLAMISFSYYLSFVLVFKTLDGQAWRLFVQSLPVVLLLKIVVFYLSSLYRRTWAYSSLEDTLTILKATVFSSLSSVIVFSLIFKLSSFGGVVFFILDFYLLSTFVTGFRISYRVFNSFYKRGAANRGKRVLIYGAGYRGSTVLREIRNNEGYSFSPAGFIDDAPEKIGKNMNGLPILGSVEDLDEILKDNKISEVIISTAKIGKDKIKKLTEFCQQKGISLRQFEYRFYEFP